MESATTGTIKTFIAGNLIVSILLSLTLAYLIGAFNAMQILVLQILFRLAIPLNVHYILGPILKLSNFDVFQTDFIYEKVFGFEETESFD